MGALVKSGKELNLWYDNWLNGGPIINRISKDEASWIGVNTDTKVSRCRQVKWPRGRRRTSNIVEIQEQIKNFEFNEEDDKFDWKLTNDGAFSWRASGRS
ncbi:hypothetical protein LIER_07570 [Lithospermum erythrorhizon]|uniref:Uncharacterized protein n=1 Tax=Lithospermum erythrorhizon TaxID=34254 RepID=A0AAV3PA01_LITER